MFALLLMIRLALPVGDVEGWVRAAESREAVAGAVVRVPQLGRVARTDARGAFTLRGLPQGSWAVRVEALGYRPHEATVGVPASGAVRLEFLLESEPVELDPVEVRGREDGAAGSLLASGAAAGPAPVGVDASIVAQSPVLVEPDIFRTLQTLPSVQAASDFSTALYVRGGLPDQNLVTLDGAPLFNPFHLGGIFSAFDPDATRWAGLLPGAFPAGVGDRLSSAIDVRTRDGGEDRVRGSGAVGLISSRMTLDGPLPGRRGSFLLSGRRTYLDAAANGAHALGLIPGPFPYGFSDGHLKLTYPLGAGMLSASAYLDREGVSFRASEWSPSSSRPMVDDVAEFGWGSRMATARWSTPVGRWASAELRAGISEFRGDFLHAREPLDGAAIGAPGDTASWLDARTVQRDLFAAGELAWSRGRHGLRAGFQADRYLFDHRVRVQAGQFNDLIPPFERRDDPTTLALYAEEEWSPTDALSLRAGVRLLTAGEYGTEWLPRLGIRYDLSPTVSLSAGAGRTAQVVRSLRNEESVWSSLVAYDFLAAVPRESGLSTADDLTAQVEWSRGGSTVRLDAYAKRMRGLPIAPLPDDLAEAPVFHTDSARLGEARARGLELLARHARGRSTFSLSYALGFATMEAGGERFTPRYERRHALDLSAALPLGERGTFSVRAAWATGQPYTPVVGITRGFGYEPATGALDGRSLYDRTLVVGEHNSARLPGYFRVDVGARRAFTRRLWGKEVELTPYLSVLNVLNTPNVLFALPQSGFEGVPRIEYPPQLPIFPTLGIEWKF